MDTFCFTLSNGSFTVADFNCKSLRSRYFKGKIALIETIEKSDTLVSTKFYTHQRTPTVLCTSQNILLKFHKVLHICSEFFYINGNRYESENLKSI